MYQVKVTKSPDVDQETFESALYFSRRRIENEIDDVQLRAIVRGDLIAIESADPTANWDDLKRKIKDCFCVRDGSLYEDFESIVWETSWS
ncbi:MULTISPECIES: hypothetical protein [Aeromonas]|uniref:hypothetical protein n=1 Tax=Aeromonas TaxID=642 RepID=UPI0011C8A509|nr:hypothetical protein [Aeromonas veronii]MBL0588882.1 hypothetical protein [Aeromonas veronii]QHC08445.1 hypothetical protein GRF56_14035 [Aeromonas veronii]